MLDQGRSRCLVQRWIVFRAFAGVAAAALAAGALSGCSGKGSSASVPEGVDAKDRMLSPNAQANERMIGLEQMWREAQSGSRGLPEARESLKQMIWKSSAPDVLRVRAVELLLTDESPEGLADTRNLLRLRLPTESSWAMIEAISAAAAARGTQEGWRDMTAALVRSYARRVPTPADNERPERAALIALHPGKPVEAIVFDTFLRPTENGAVTTITDWPEKTRQSAWELLARLDPQGTTRGQLLAGSGGGNGGASGDTAVLQDLARAARELGVVPLTGSELAWLQRLMDPKNAENAAWYTQTVSAVARLGSEQRSGGGGAGSAGLRLRHLEPIRWSAEHRPEWLSASREQLIATLKERLDGRRVWRKTTGLGDRSLISRETINERADELSWGDALSILVIDEALQTQNVRQAMFAQSLADRADTSAEHGGALSAGVAKAYLPRPAQRVNDRTFVASDDLFKNSDRALAHYHFHAQTETNEEYAGPGRGDIDYALAHGRSCLVLTSVREGVLNVDYYIASIEPMDATDPRRGVTIDLGELTAR